MNLKNWTVGFQVGKIRCYITNIKNVFHIDITNMNDCFFTQGLSVLFSHCKMIKVWCAFQLVAVSILPHAEFGPNDHRKDTPTLSNNFSRDYATDASNLKLKTEQIKKSDEISQLIPLLASDATFSIQIENPVISFREKHFDQKFAIRDHK